MSSPDLSILYLVTQASIVVQAIMLFLLLLSVLSWCHIFNKLFAIRAAKKRATQFEKLFWSGKDLRELYKQVQYSKKAIGVEKIFEAGLTEFNKLCRQAEMGITEIIEGTRRAMRAACQRDLDALDARNVFLASVGSVSPYIGLLGTVWGIMNAFRSLSNVGQATLMQVAPGIAEALIATAVGLFSAIPAVVAYNRFVYDIDRLSHRFDSFIEEFSNILQRSQVAQLAKKGSVG